MPDYIKIYGVNMSGFGFGEAQKSFHHNEGCIAERKDIFNAKDKLVGVAYHEASDKDYLLYSCSKCGGTYAVEGQVPNKVMKGL